MPAEEADCLSHSVVLPRINMHIHKFQLLSFCLATAPPAPTLPVTRLFSHHVYRLIFHSKREVGLIEVIVSPQPRRFTMGGKGTKRKKKEKSSIITSSACVIL